MNPSLAAPAGTRDRILAHLEENRTATVVTLSRAWGLTRADIRYHLNHLIEEGLVERMTGEQAGTNMTGKSATRGRPAAIYRLTVQSAPDNFVRLSEVLLNALLDGVPEEEREAVLRGIAAGLAGDAVEDTRVTSMRLHRAVEQLNQQAYSARWEASPSGPRFLLRACPYAAVLDRHPGLCRMDLYLLERLSGLPLRQSARMGSAPACVFLPR